MADYYRFFPDLYEVDTAHLTLAEHGAYRKLIDKYMKARGPLPDNDRALASLIGCMLDEWLAVAPAVRPMFRIVNGKLFHKRCDAELDWQDSRTRIRQEISAKGVEARRKKSNDLPTNGITNGHTVGRTVGQPHGQLEERRGEEIYKPPLRDTTRETSVGLPKGEPPPLPEPGIKSAADAVARLAAARTKLFPDRKPLPPDQVRAKWQQKVFKFAQTRLSDAEYQRLVTEAANDTPEGRAWMNRLSDEMRAVEAERERRSATP